MYFREKGLYRALLKKYGSCRLNGPKVTWLQNARQHLYIEIPVRKYSILLRHSFVRWI